MEVVYYTEGTLHASTGTHTFTIVQRQKNGGINICNYFVGSLLILNTHQHHALFGMRSMSFLEFFANNPGIQTPDVTTSKVNYACQIIDFFHD